MKTNKNSYIFILVFFPYIYLFPHTFGLVEMGNDFELLYYSYKKYIFEFFKIGLFPKWSPSESLGYSLIFNPFAQYFYPPSWLLYALCFFVGDLSKHTYFLYTVFGLSIYNLGQFFWLKSIGLEKKYCLYATIIICMGLKLTEILRFPNAVHAFAWAPWILYGITVSNFHLDKTKSSLIIFFSTLMILTAGYPYFIFYVLILGLSYFLFINLNFVRKEIFKNLKIIKTYKSFFICTISSIVAFVVTLPWLNGIMEIMKITRDRNLYDITYSYSLSSSFIDQIGSWILPPLSIAEGYYYFGSIITLCIFFYFYNTFFNNKKINKLDKYFIIFFTLFLFLNYQFANPEKSVLFKFLWNQFDFIKNFRVFSRMNITLVPLFSLLICLFLKHLDDIKIDLRSLIFIFVITVCIILLQVYFLEIYQFKNVYWETWQGKRINYLSNKINFFKNIIQLYNNYIYSFFFILSFFSFLIIKFYNKKVKFISLIIILVFSELFILANIQWAIPKGYYDSNNYNSLSKRPLNDLKNALENKNVVTEVKGNTYFRNQRKFNINYFDDFGIDAHTKHFDNYFHRSGKEKNINEINKVKFFWGMDDKARKIFFSTSLSYKTIPDLVYQIDKDERAANNLSIKILEYTGDDIMINVNTKVDGYIIFVDNWAPGWTVKVNGQGKDILKALDTYKAVKINKGNSIIKFYYNPW